MNSSSAIDITFDFRTDTPPGKDPDALSPTLRRYHKLLWSKPLPGGDMLELVDTTPGVYLHHRSDPGEFRLTSDAVIPTFRKEARLSHILMQLPEEMNSFMETGYTIGGMLLFPGNRIDRKITINGARGFHPRIKDRFDLTLECIRRHYLNEANPLGAVLDRYADYFRLFDNFRGFVEFFLLHDLVTDDCSTVKYFSPFDQFTPSPVPDGMAAWLAYREHAMAFIRARNQRIRAWCETHRSG